MEPELKEAQARLQSSEERFRLLVQSTPDYSIIMLDEQGLVQGWNPGAERMTGFRSDEIVGEHISKFYPPEDAKQGKPQIELQCAELKGVWEDNGWRVRKDGSRFCAHLVLTALRDENGHLRGFAEVIRDETERTDALHQLSDSETRLRAIFRGTMDAIIALDEDEEIVLFNPAAERMFGRSAAEAQGQALDRFVRGADPGPLSMAGRAEENAVVWLIGKRAGGDEFPIEATISQTVGDVPLFILVLRDATERKEAEAHQRQMEQKLQEAQKLDSLGVLAGGIAHDFNNLLTGILGNASLVARDFPTGSPTRACLAEIEKSALRAADLCSQMLAYSGQGRYLVEPLDLPQVIEEGLTLLKLSVGKRSVIRPELKRNLPRILADGAQIRQIVMNLVSNASEAIGSTGGVITLRTGVMHADQSYFNETVTSPELPTGEYVWLEVSDTGGGMDEETLAKIFDPFFTSKFAGRGLGLPAVLGIVRGHRGAIKVESEGGKGSTFRVLLPALPSSQEDAGSSAAGVPISTREPAVMVVDDEQSVRSVAGKIIEALGFGVTEAADGDEAIAIFREHPAAFDLVLLDLTMPTLDGRETLEELRKLRSDIKVILMSGFSEREVTRQFSDVIPDGFIQKPFSFESLQNKLEKTLAR